MPHNYNTSLISRAIQKFNIKDGIFFRNDLPWTLTPVVAINPVSEIRRWSTPTTSGTTTLYSTPSDKDFYITDVALSFVKDVTCDIATGSVFIQATFGGVSQILVGLAVLTLTAERGELAISFPTPLKVDRSSNVTMTGTFTAGAMSRVGVVSGYTENTLS